MNRGINPLSCDKKKIRKFDTVDKHPSGTFNQLNLRRNQSYDSSKISTEKGSGDSQITIKKRTSISQYLLQNKPNNTSLFEPRLNQQPPGYDNSKTTPRPQSSKNCHSVTIDEFLVPLKEKPSTQELYSKSVVLNRRKSSTHPVIPSSTGAAVEAGNFPFKSTPSGNLKVKSRQVVFETEKLSVLVANPDRTKINVFSQLNRGEMAEDDCHRHSAMDNILHQVTGLSGLGSIIGGTPHRTEQSKQDSEYAHKTTSQILDPELNLNRLGYTGTEEIDWTKVGLPDKKELFMEIIKRITHKKNADCKIHIDREEFQCHLIVLQCYSELFDGYVAIKRVEIPPDKCSAASFSFIYDWMATEEQHYKHFTRQNVLDIFNSAKYLKIKDLVEQCWAFIDNVDIFYEDTAFLLYVDAKDKDLDEVRELMLPRIQEFFLILVSSQDWLDLDVADVKALLTSNYVRINTEMELFMSAIRWLKFDWEHRDRYKYEVLQCVRFGNISPWQLVDIKRNPENPEFMEVAKDPKICKLIDDGLGFVIIKYWYGPDKEDFGHWNEVLGLKEPQGRNWTGMDKEYFTYREFLIYLDLYRRNKLIEKSKNKNGPGGEDKAVPRKMAASKPLMASLKQKKTKSVHIANIKTPTLQDRSTAATNTPKKTKISELIQEMSEDENAGATSEAEEVFNALKLFTPSKNCLAKDTLNRLSTSVLGPGCKQYMLDSSLFLHERETILIFGGVDPHVSYGVGQNSGREIFRYLPDSNRWECVGELPEPRHHHSACFMRGRIYIAGGSDPRDDEMRGKSFVVSTVWSFEPVRRCWFSEESLKEPRKNFGLVVCQQKMYAIGGCSRDVTVLASVERYDPKTCIWSQMAPMKFPRAGPACAKYRNYIWAAGGSTDIKKNVLLQAVESYDVSNNQWTRITRLEHPRGASCMFVMSDRVYLIGGAGHKFSGDKKSTTMSMGNVEIWEHETTSWKKIADLTIPRQGHSLAYVGSQIFILGGVTTIFMRSLSNVECFCTKRGTFVRGIACLPIALSGHAAVTLPPAMLLSGS